MSLRFSTSSRKAVMARAQGSTLLSGHDERREGANVRGTHRIDAVIVGRQQVIRRATRLRRRESGRRRESIWTGCKLYWWQKWKVQSRVKVETSGA